MAAKNTDYSEYFSQLSSKEKQRYLSKVLLLGGIDPYALKSKDLSEDSSLLPPIR